MSLRLKITVLAVVILSSTLTMPAARPPAVTNSTPAIDLTPAIKIGAFTTSRYLFEKAYDRFVESVVRQTGKKPDLQERGRWFRLYVARQLIEAGLVKRKRLDRPEVKDVTERMAEYMLTQPNGPLYQKLRGGTLTDRIAYRRERRARILEESRFSASAGNIRRLWSLLAPAWSRGAPLHDQDVAPIGSSVLARYTFDGTTRRITARAFVRDFRRGIARMAPHDASSLRTEVEDMVLAKYDLAEAKRLRLDRTPQFLQDRRNFALNQALALYEQAVLARRVTVSRAELVSRYQTEIRRYSSPVEITGTLYLFSNLEQARRRVPPLPGANRPGVTPAPEKVVERFVVRRDDPARLPGVPYALLASMPDGRSLGPFPYAGAYAVFLKRDAGNPTPLPFEQVEPELRRELIREKLDVLELDDLARNAGRVQVCLDPAKYGLPKLVP